MMSQENHDQSSEIANEIANVNILEKLSRKMDNIRVAEYVEMMSNPKKVIFMNFVAGLARGLGMGIGFTVLAGVVLYLLRSWVNLPYIGKIIADLLNIIDGYR